MKDGAAGGRDDGIARMGIDELREQLKKTKREVTNRDTTLKALQRNYETLASVHEESKSEHQRRNIAFDQVDLSQTINHTQACYLK